jgi:hypothetical protein
VVQKVVSGDRRGGASELVTDGVTVFIARFPSPGDIGEALERASQLRRLWKLLESGQVYTFGKSIQKILFPILPTKLTGV